MADRAAGLKMYLGDTYGDLLLDDTSVWATHLETWPGDRPLAVHAEGAVLESMIGIAESIGRPIHICHVAGAGDMAVIAAAKDRGAAITCEVAPHHLFLDRTSDLSPGRADVRPSLGTPEDRHALWNHLELIDCFASDHAPHTPAEKDGVDPPPGFPGLETTLPLLLTAVHGGLLTVGDIVERLHVRPAEIFGLPTDADTWVEVDVDAEYEIDAVGHSKCGWTPFAGTPVRGRVDRVVIRGVTAFENRRVVASPGMGRNLRSERRSAA